MTAEEQPPPGGEPGTKPPSGGLGSSVSWKSPTAVTAIVVLLGFVAFVVYMLTAVDVEDTTWTRLVYVFGSVEAIVFAAAGAMFGTQVQRAQTEDAKERAQSQERRADRNVEGAARGQALAKTVKVAKKAGAEDGGGQSFGPPGVGGSTAEVDRLAAVAEELFPDV
jgi:hypothetical protein